MRKAQKTPFFAFSVIFVQSVSKDVKKHCFLILFVEGRAKSLINAVFRIFCELCTKCLEKRKKNTIFHISCGTSCKKSQKTPFFEFFANFAQRVLKKREETLFSHNFVEGRLKSTKNAVFSHFCDLCTKCLEKREKTLFSHTFRGRSCKKLNKRRFSVFYANFLRSSLKT